MQLYPGNNLSNYKVHFPNSVPLNNTYEVGLSEIHLSKFIDSRIKTTDKETIIYKDYEFKVGLHTFKDKNDLCEHLNTILDHIMTTYYNSVDKPPAICIEDEDVYKGGHDVILSKSLELKLRKSKTTHFYVYCSIIKPSYVGDALVPLLRIVNAEDGKFSMIYENPQYHRVGLNHINNIEIDIRDDLGHPISFKTGRTVCVLHAKKIVDV
jgi:hypothetical protein